jgi:hypothetical protein
MPPHIAGQWGHGADGGYTWVAGQHGWPALASAVCHKAGKAPQNQTRWATWTCRWGAA